MVRSYKSVHVLVSLGTGRGKIFAEEKKSSIKDLDDQKPTVKKLLGFWLPEVPFHEVDGVNPP